MNLAENLNLGLLALLSKSWDYEYVPYNWLRESPKIISITVLNFTGKGQYIQAFHSGGVGGCGSASLLRSLLF